MRKVGILLIVIFGCLLSCDQKQTNDAINEEYYLLDFDRIRSILMELEVFPAEAEGIEISKQDISKFEAILKKYIDESFNKEASYKIHLEEYGRQYVAASTGSGNEFVYVNCFCRPKRFEDREKRLIVTSDGGQCFFSLKINRNTGEVLDFKSNGLV